MQPIKALKDELIEFGESLLWENFEATQVGHLTFSLPRRCLIEDEDNPCYYPFYMRVGLHLGQVMQVIMSCGHFVKFRKESRWPKENYAGMKALDPTRPGDSLYRYYSDPGHQHLVPIGVINEHWRPDLGYSHQHWIGAQQAQYPLNPYQQYQLQQYPTYTGYGTAGGASLSGGYVTPQYTTSNILTSGTVTLPASTVVGSTVVIGNTTP